MTAADKIPLKTLFGFLAMSVGTFMANLDTQIVAASLPKIAATIGATIEETSRIQSAYMIAEVIMIPLTGWLSRLLSLRRLYAIAALCFTITSLLCGFAGSIETLIVVRIMQGLCSGVMSPLLYQGIYLLFTRERRPGATLFATLIISLAPVIGPSLGGWITEAFSWRWMFLINIIPGICVSLTVFTLITGNRGDPEVLKGFDLAGILFAACFLGSLEYLLDNGPELDWFSSRLIVFLGIFAVVALLLLVWRELTCRTPVINLSAFREAPFAIGCLLNFVMGVGLFCSGYLMTLFLGTVKQYDSSRIGHVMAITGCAMFVSVPFARRIRMRLGRITSLLLGVAIFGLSLRMNSCLTVESGFGELFLPQIFRGMGIILSLAPITDVALGHLPVEMLPNATGLFTLMRSLGGGIGIAIANILAEQRTRLHYHRLVEALSPTEFTEHMNRIELLFADRMIDADQVYQAGARMVGRMVNRQAMVMAYCDLWYLASWLFVGMIVIVPAVGWVVGRQTPATPVGGPG
ncbi:multidrug export protein EmrB [Geobacter sp. OR-1]|uniref:DHA2 family efflux MFS transporter permease subunit n=1 Tax=Geobacter sp. OR-1 TaxID=1266765 RepID=UPI000544224C|nr:DHA2 family efflux MFS transporter permease subunit [Geobacter sp. OR-1]GAM11132.1 multidrug export protein EmrB [Geobacter sp. OR-1]